MAYLAGSLRQLFREIDALWPNRDHGTDGWIGDKAHQNRKSDHNPDDRGMVHAIDIDKDGINPQYVIDRVARADRPTNYLVYNRKIYSRSRDFAPRNYTGDNPHTSHIHVSILYGDQWEGTDWAWDIADLGKGTGEGTKPVAVDDLWDWMGHFDNAATWTVNAGDGFQQSVSGLYTLAR